MKLTGLSMGLSRAVEESREGGAAMETGIGRASRRPGSHPKRRRQPRALPERLLYCIGHVVVGVLARARRIRAANDSDG